MWEELAPELLANVVQRVQSRQDDEPKESRRMVAMAGVCKWWRQHILHLANHLDEEKNDLVQFPFKLMHPPGPKQHIVQCLLKRRGSLFLLFQARQHGEELHHFFLLAARRKWRPTGFSYLVGLDPRSVSSSGKSTLLGKLKSNFWASEFVLWRAREQGDAPVVSLRFLEHVVNGIRQRRIWCALPPPPCSLGTGLVSELDKKKKKKKNSVLRRMLLSSCTSNPRVGAAKGSGSTTTTVTSTPITNSTTVTGTTDNSTLELRSKIPAWDAQQLCWSLDFQGRATMPSMHNFQLVAAVEEQQNNNIILQLGKIDRNLYTMDFCYPLSAFQAFGICLSSFATSAGVEP